MTRMMHVISHSHPESAQILNRKAATNAAKHSDFSPRQQLPCSARSLDRSPTIGSGFPSFPPPKEMHGYGRAAAERTASQAAEKLENMSFRTPFGFLNGVRNLLFPWLSCGQQISHPQTTRVRDNKRAFSAACSAVPQALAINPALAAEGRLSLSTVNGALSTPHSPNSRTQIFRNLTG
jgi:hypothetical protein